MRSVTQKTKIWCNNHVSRRFGRYSFKIWSPDSSFVLSYLITTVLFSDEESNTSTYREDSSRRPSSDDDHISSGNENVSDEDFQENEPLRHIKAKKSSSKKKEIFKKVDNRKNKNPKKTVSKKHRERVEKEPAPATSSSENTSE